MRDRLVARSMENCEEKCCVFAYAVAAIGVGTGWGTVWAPLGVGVLAAASDSKVEMVEVAVVETAVDGGEVAGSVRDAIRDLDSEVAAKSVSDWPGKSLTSANNVGGGGLKFPDTLTDIPCRVHESNAPLSPGSM